jgi:hypothetical protein
MPQSLTVLQMTRYGYVAALILFVLAVSWIVSLAFAPVPPAGATASERIEFLAQNEGWHIANFAIVVPMGFIHIPLWLGLAAIIWSRRPAIATMVAAFGLIYAPFTVIGYWTQLGTVRGVAELHNVNPEAATAAFEVLEFSGNSWSWSYGLVMLGYGTWGIAALAVFVGLSGIRYRLARITSWLYGTAGVLGVAGAIGFVMRIELIELAVLFSGVISVPALISSAVLLYQVSNGLSLENEPRDQLDAAS